VEIDQNEQLEVIGDQHDQEAKRMALVRARRSLGIGNRFGADIQEVRFIFV